jgi:hypothetical protein
MPVYIPPIPLPTLLPLTGGSESKLVNEIKTTHPSLKEVIPIFKKYGYDIRTPHSRAIFLKYNLIHYLKKDKRLMAIRKKSASKISVAYKEMRTLGKTRKRK